jgi:general secretion pathway protein D
MKTRIILTPMIFAITFICAGELSNSIAQPEPSPNIAPDPSVLEGRENQLGQTAPSPLVPGQLQSPGPRFPVPVVQQQLQQPAPSGGATPPSVSPPQVSPTPVAPERRLLPTPTVPAPSGGMISLNFTRADLVEIIHIIAQHLRLTYTIDPEVKGTVTINSAEPLKSEDLLPIFHQVLRMNGAVAVRSGNLYRIIPIKDGKSIARPAGQSREDSFALQIVPVRYFTAAEMKRLLTPFLMSGGEIVENPRGNFLIVIDLPSNIQRLVEIAELVDVQVFAGTRMEIYQPKVASAEELAQEMIKIMQSFSASTPQTDSFNAQFIALPRINQLLVISHSEAAWTYAKRWIDRIDVVAEGPGRRIFIYPVENSKAADLADVLGQALGLPTSTARAASPSLQTLHRSTAGGGSGTSPGMGRTTSPTGGGGFGTTSPTGGAPFSGFAAFPVPGQPAPQGLPAPTPVPGPGQPGQPRPGTPTPAAPGAKPEEQLRVVADPGTNSLIVYGTAQEFQNIKNILKELDAVPRQVLMDVLIAEVQLNNDESFGVDYQIAQGAVSIFGQTFGSRGSVLTGILSSVVPPATGTVLSQFPQGITGIIGNSQTVRALINALQSDSRIRILSSPSVLASDNRPARIQVGSEEPIATGQVIAATGAVNPSSSTTIQYRNTGRIVTIVPQVNSQGLVNLQILAEVSQRGANVTVGTDSFPAFDIRQAETTAVVQNGETLVIGGIIADNRSHDRTGIPYLMDIPVFGRFFGTTTERTRRTELIMLITPNVIRNREESRATTEEFKNKVLGLRNELERLRRDQERELERRNKLAPVEPKDAAPDQPTDVPPSPGALAPGQQSPARQSSPTPGGGASSSAPAVRSSDASETIQSPPLRDSIEFRLQRKLEAPPATPAPSAATTKSKELPPAMPSNREESGVASLQNPGFANLAKSGATEAQKPRASAPEQVWVVQIASYSRDADARAIAKKLKDKGYNVSVVTGDVAGQPRYRVEVGPLANRSDAQAIQKELATVHKLEQAFVLNRGTNPSSSAQPR